MRPELSEKLKRDFPLFLNNKWVRLSVGNGWEPLLRALGEKIEPLIKEIPESDREKYQAIQVKQKFGSLQVYADYQTPEMTNLIDLMTELSLRTCELCGKKGEGRTNCSWIRTLCDTHALLSCDQIREILRQQL